MVMELLNSTVKILSEGVVQWKKALLKIPGDKPGPCSAVWLPARAHLVRQEVML